MFLQDGNLVIRNSTTDDSIILCNWWNDCKVMSHAGYPNGLGITPYSNEQDLLTDDDNIHRRLILEIHVGILGKVFVEKMEQMF